MNALQRPDWYGDAVRLSIVWTLTNQDAHTLVRSQVCRSEDQVLTTQDQWKAAMQTKGWP